MRFIYFWIIIALIYPITSTAQIAHYNQYPTMHVDEYMDGASNLSFAYSMRKLYSDYTGPIIKLRRSSDNATMDFYATDTDLVNIAAITSWASSSTLYVHTWYDQSGSGRNAVQTNTDFQPQFYADTTLPYFNGDGVNDYLAVQNGNIQNVTTAGKNGSLFTVAKATELAQLSLGVASDADNGYDRWAISINYYNGANTDRTFFDPGNFQTTAFSNRYFTNTGGIGQWKQYSFIARSTSVLARRNSVTQLNKTYTTPACSLTENFFIGAAASPSNIPVRFASTGFNELILFKTDVTSDIYENIEQSQISFWGL